MVRSKVLHVFAVMATRNATKFGEARWRTIAYLRVTVAVPVFWFHRSKAPKFRCLWLRADRMCEPLLLFEQFV